MLNDITRDKAVVEEQKAAKAAKANPPVKDKITTPEDKGSWGEIVRSLVPRLIEVIEDKADVTKRCNDCIKEILEEAKREGLDPKVLRAVAMKKIKFDKMDEKKRDRHADEERLFVVYSRDVRLPTQLDLFE